MTVSVAIVNWNSGPLLERALRSLSADDPNREVIIVDNASVDGSLDFASRCTGSVTILWNSDNMGFAAACNQAWRRSRGELTLFLNPDAEARPGSVERLAQALRSDSSVWAAGGRLLSPDGKPQIGFNVRSFPTVGCVLAETLLLDEILPGNRWTRAYRMTDWDHASLRDVDQPAGACLMVRRDVLETLGGFDERYRPAWFEDVDLCRRIRNAGGRIIFVPGADFLHYGGSSLARLKRQEFLEAFYKNRIRYFAMHHGRRAASHVRTLTTLGLRLRAFLSLVHPGVGGQGRLSSARIFRETARRIAAMPEVLS
ncbi:MAG: glycosyltransferase family 2 protein [Acidobacteria bacterium]|nr:glycosyltransferase family 2 protein [Acidobacteriota bacterium]